MNYFAKLYTERRSLALITWGYLIISVLALLVAGIFALIDQNLGRSILFVPLLSFLACAGNLVIWALIKLAIDTFTTRGITSNKEATISSKLSATPSQNKRNLKKT